MKKLLSIAAALLLTTAVYAGPESSMEKTFKTLFPYAEQVKWHQDNDGYLVSFKQGGMPSVIMYDNKGKFLVSLRYYSEKDLPTNILLAVKKKYKTETIWGVTERTTNDEVTYHIALMDNGEPLNIVAYSNGTIASAEQPQPEE